MIPHTTSIAKDALVSPELQPPRLTSTRTSAADSFVEIAGLDQGRWSQVCRGFVDANLYQTWPYEVVRSGISNVSHFLLRRAGVSVAAAQARLVKTPVPGVKFAYILWGPLWKCEKGNTDAETLRPVLQALREEYVRRRGFVLRIFPN